MQGNLFTRSLLATLVVGTLAACDQSPVGPVNPDLNLGDASADARTTTARPTGTTTGRVPLDTLRNCRIDETPGLTPEQIEKIRALYAAYHAEVDPLLRYIAEIEKQAREAKANGASDERVAEILAQADEAKRQVAKATERLRDAINAVLNEEQRHRRCVLEPIAIPSR
jgi:hypothetical protein